MEAYVFSECSSTSVASMLGNHRRLNTQTHGPREVNGDLLTETEIQEVPTKMTKSSESHLDCRVLKEVGKT